MSMGVRSGRRVRESINTADGRAFYIQIFRDMVALDAALDGNGVHAERFAKKRGVSVKTVRRWVHVMQELGFPVETRKLFARGKLEHRWFYVTSGRMFVTKNVAHLPKVEEESEAQPLDWIVPVRLQPGLRALIEELAGDRGVEAWVRSLVARELKQLIAGKKRPRKPK